MVIPMNATGVGMHYPSTGISQWEWEGMVMLLHLKIPNMVMQYFATYCPVCTVSTINFDLVPVDIVCDEITESRLSSLQPDT